MCSYIHISEPYYVISVEIIMILLVKKYVLYYSFIIIIFSEDISL